MLRVKLPNLESRAEVEGSNLDDLLVFLGFLNIAADVQVAHRHLFFENLKRHEVEDWNDIGRVVH